jgi:hypothetical protein
MVARPIPTSLRQTRCGSVGVVTLTHITAKEPGT